jgi:hypothetical protein
MATNWKMNEVMGLLKNGKIEDLQDVGKRFPLTMMAVASGDLEKVLGAIPDYITVRKIESMLKGDVSDAEDEEVADDVAEEAPKAEKSKRGRKPKAKVEEEVEEDEEQDYSEMQAVDLYKLCKKRGIKAEPKQKANAYIKLLKEADKAMNEPEDDEDDWEDDEPVKKADKKADKKSEKKPVKVEDDDEDDWDI